MEGARRGVVEVEGRDDVRGERGDEEEDLGPPNLEGVRGGREDVLLALVVGREEEEGRSEEGV